eukprot:gene13292-13422_t
MRQAWRIAKPSRPWAQGLGVNLPLLHSHHVASAIAARRNSNWDMPAEECVAYQGMLNKLTRFHAKEAASKLDLKYRLGLADRSKAKLNSKASPSGDEAAATTGSTPVCWEVFKSSKLQHPLAVALVRVGAFYEAVGIDAVLLMEHCGLNAMGGPHKDVPRAGCPEANLQQHLDQLVQGAGLDVAVWEEQPVDKAYGRKRNEQKSRYLQQLVTPESPVYLFAFQKPGSGDCNINTPNIVGVACSTSGLSVFVFNRASQKMRQYNGLSEDGMWGIINADRLAKPVVYLHRCIGDTPASPNTPEGLALAVLHKRLSREDLTVRWYTGADARQAFDNRLKLALGLPAEAQFGQATDYVDETWQGVRPLYYSTASQLGLEKWRGVPMLAAYLLPEGALKVEREFLRGLLTCPPPFGVASQLRRAVQNLMAYDKPLPKFNPTGGSMTPSKVHLVLGASEPRANERFFLALISALLPVESSLNTGDEDLQAVMGDIWPLLCHSLWQQDEQYTQSQVLMAVTAALQLMQKVVPHSNVPIVAASSSEEALPNDRRLRQVHRTLKELSEGQETWSMRVQLQVIHQEVSQLDDANDQLCQALHQILLGVDVLHQQAAFSHIRDSQLPELRVDQANCAIWLKMPNTKLRHALEHQGFTARGRHQVLRKPFNRDGALLKQKDCYTCDLLDQHLDLYRVAVANVNVAVTHQLAVLTEQLQQYRAELAAAVQLGIVTSSIVNHAQAARHAGWTVPLVGPGEQQQLTAGGGDMDNSGSSTLGGSGSSSDARSSTVAGETVVVDPGRFFLRGVWPYWMSCKASSTVSNDVTLQGFMLLTGPNMAGKSTVLRAVAAAALLGSAGLAIPAAAGSELPLLDAIILRTFSGDAPQEALSAFAVEMKEMSFVLKDARRNSLVLIDELGKGTEVLSGTAVSAAMLKRLLEVGARGVFATHLHLLSPLLSKERDLHYYKMQVVQQRRQSPISGEAVGLLGDRGSEEVVCRPTWRLVAGHCGGSLALSVAKQQGLPEDVLRSAMEYQDEIHQMGGYQALLDAAETGFDYDDGDANRRTKQLEQESKQSRTNYDSSSTNINGSRSSSLAADPAWGAATDLGCEKEAAELAIRCEWVQQRLSELAASTCQAADPGTIAPVVHHLPGAEVIAPPRHRNVGLIYVLLFPTGYWYVGETEDVNKRRKQHRSRLGKKFGPNFETWYVLLDDQSSRQELQGRMIQEMSQKAFPMASTHDAARARKK